MSARLFVKRVTAGSHGFHCAELSRRKITFLPFLRWKSFASHVPWNVLARPRGAYNIFELPRYSGAVSSRVRIVFCVVETIKKTSFFLLISTVSYTSRRQNIRIKRRGTYVFSQTTTEKIGVQDSVRETFWNRYDILNAVDARISMTSRMPHGHENRGESTRALGIRKTRHTVFVFFFY